MQKRRKPSVKKAPTVVETNDVIISPTYSIETVTSMSDMSNIDEMSPRRRLSAAFRAVDSRIGDASSTENFTKSEETIQTGKDSPQWTAVYPLPSLSNFTKRLLNSHSSNKKKKSTSSEQSSEITANSGENQPLLCTMSPLLAAKQASTQSEHTTSNFGIGSCWLCAARDLPPWHFRHRHVSGGYRQCRTFAEACVSIFQWHNESINIWSHLFGAMLLVRKVAIVSQSLFATIATTTQDDTPITCFTTPQETKLFVVFLTGCMVFGNVVPIASSAFCHTFYGLSPVWHRTCWFVDFVGLMCGVLGITTGYLAILFLSPSLAPVFYLAVTISLVTFAYFIRNCYRVFLPRLMAPVLQPHDRFPEFAGNMAKFSAVNFVLATLVTVVFCPQYFEHERLRAVVSSVAVFPVSLVLSLVIFAQGGVPERFSFWWSLPVDFFDYLGHSHQWWHVASCTILYLWLDVVQAHFQARWALGCNV